MPTNAGLIAALRSGLGTLVAFVEDADVGKWTAVSDDDDCEYVTSYVREKREMEIRRWDAGAAAGTGPGSGAGAGASAAGAAMPPADTSREYIEQCVTPVEVNNTAELRNALLAPLGRALPVNAWQRLMLVQGDASLGTKLASVQEAPEVGTAHSFRDWVSVRSTRQFVSGLQFVALFVADTICTLAQYFPELRIRVDQSGGTGARLRPDLLCWVKDVLLFRGEHKADRREFNIALEELREEMAKARDSELQPGVRLPFMLAYAAAGSLLQFYAIDTSAANGNVQMVDISRGYDLALQADRVAALHAICNVFRILRHTALSIPAGRARR